MGRGPSQKSLDKLVKNMENGGYHEPSWLSGTEGHLNDGGRSQELGQGSVPSDLYQIMKGLTDYKSEVPTDIGRQELQTAQDCVDLIQQVKNAKETAARKVPLRQNRVDKTVSEYLDKLTIVGKRPGVLDGEVAYFVKINGKTPLGESKGKFVYLERLIHDGDGRRVGVESEQYKRGVFAEGIKSILKNADTAGTVPDLPEIVYAEALDKNNSELSDAYLLIVRPDDK